MTIRTEGIGRSRSQGENIEDVSITLPSGEMTEILGPSGCGKKKVLHMIAGLEKPDTGVITFDGTVVFSASDGIDLAPKKRGAVVVYADAGLLTHKDVFDNVAAPLTDGLTRQERKTKVRAALETCHLAGMEDRYPKDLAPWQKQMAALARALVREPKCLLFDEPMTRLPRQVRLLVREITKKAGITSLFVAGDPETALSISDHVVVMDLGKVVQEGTPEEIFRHPKTRFAANITGLANWIDESSMVRPMDLKEEPSTGDTAFSADIAGVSYAEDGYELHLLMDGHDWFYRSAKRPEKDSITLYCSPEKVLRFE